MLNNKQKMVKKIIFLLVLLMVLPIGSALDTQISVKTLSDHKVLIQIFDPVDSHIIESFFKTADIIGETSVVYTSGGEGQIDVGVTIAKDGEEVLYEKFEDYSLGEDISIRIDFIEISGDYDANPEPEPKENFVENKTVEVTNASNNETVVEEIDEKPEGAAATGNVVSEGSGGVPKYVYFIVAGLLIASAVVFLVVKRNSMKNGGGVMMDSRLKPSVKMSSNTGFKPSPISNQAIGLSKGAEIQMLEAKIKEFQKEITQLKNDDRTKEIKEAEKKLESDKRELERLKR